MFDAERSRLFSVLSEAAPSSPQADRSRAFDGIETYVQNLKESGVIFGILWILSEDKKSMRIFGIHNEIPQPVRRTIKARLRRYARRLEDRLEPLVTSEVHYIPSSKLTELYYLVMDLNGDVFVTNLTQDFIS